MLSQAKSTLASMVTTPECKQLGVRIARGGRYFVERIDHSMHRRLNCYRQG